MNRTDPTGKCNINSVSFEVNLSLDDVTSLRSFGEPNESQPETTCCEISSALPTASLPQPIHVPIQPVFTRKNTVSGRYRSGEMSFQLELRVDVDGSRPLNCVSGDFYQVTGSTISYFGSFTVNSISLVVTPSQVTIQGQGNFTFNASCPVIKVTIPRTRLFSERAPATVTWFSTTGAPGATYICPFNSIFFRTIQYEQDSVSDVTTPVFVSYDCGLLPSGGPTRILSVQAAYAEAGIEMQVSGIWNVIPADSGADVRWSDSELHAAMVKQFSIWEDTPQWKVWLLAAQLHEEGPGLYGIMFDQEGKQRQGCAVFHHGIGGITPDKLRLQLYTYVHELGHCFNMLHSWQKKFSQPPSPNRPDAKSWMNYPWKYPGGPDAFWSAFAFQFDDLELAHLRHAFRNNIIMGGNDFIIGSAVEDPEAFSKPLVDNSGLKLELRPRNKVDRFLLGEPVVVEIKLSTTDLRGVKVHSNLHPKQGFVQVAIQNPGGKVMVYEPLIEQCIAPDIMTLTADKPSIYESAFISYGKGGFYFNQPGLYKLRAMYYSLDGSLVVSDTLNIRVQSPHNSTDEEVADLFLGKEQGALLYLLGSDSKLLKNGNIAFEKVINEYDEHELAVYAKLVKGFNDGRAFKSITNKKELTVRPPMYDKAIAELSDVVDASEKDEEGVDNITLDMTMLRMAQNQKAAGDTKGAKETRERMLDIFSKKSLQPHIMSYIEWKAKNI